MAYFDLLTLGVIAICVLVSMWRGVVAETVSLLTWVVAFVSVRVGAVSVAEHVFTGIRPQGLAVLAAVLLLFSLSWVGMRLLRSALTTAVQAVGLGGLNRFLGGFFGLLKGVLLVTLVVFLASFTALPRSVEWQSARSAFVFEALARLALPYLPVYPQVPQ